MMSPENKAVKQINHAMFYKSPAFQDGKSAFDDFANAGGASSFLSMRNKN